MDQNKNVENECLNHSSLWLFVLIVSNNLQQKQNLQWSGQPITVWEQNMTLRSDIQEKKCILHTFWKDNKWCTQDNCIKLIFSSCPRRGSVISLHLKKQRTHNKKTKIDSGKQSWSKIISSILQAWCTMLSWCGPMGWTKPYSKAMPQMMVLESLKTSITWPSRESQGL